MEMFTTILAYGYLFIVGLVFLVMIIQILAYYIAGRITGSINDEVTSAFTLFGAMLVIGTASTLINAGIGAFVMGMPIPGIISFVVYLVAIVYAVVKIYELSIGKAIVHLLLSFIITAVLTGGIIYLATLVIPEGGFQINTTNEEEKEDIEIETETWLFDTPDEEMTEETETEETETMEVTDSGPKTPKIPGPITDEGSHAACSVSNPCSADNEVCLADICQTRSEIEDQFTTNVDSCTDLTCENCENGSYYNLTIILGDQSSIDLCAECDEGLIQNYPCKEGFTCLGYKCIPE